MKFFKTIRLDPSDTHVFDLAANSDEWAIPGGFAFSEVLEVELLGKRKQAFSNGFLSLQSWGFSTFVSVAEINAEQLEALVSALAEHFVQQYGAPSITDALPAARAEIDYVQDMCAESPINTLFTVKRHFDEDGEVREEFRIVDPPGEKAHTRIWEIVEE